MTKLEMYKDQILEGRRRQREEGEPNIVWIKGRMCQYRRPHSDGELITAAIVGAYFYDEYHQYIHKAYHIIHTDGSKTTIPAHWVVRTWQ